jgi:hypothetical protein
LPSLNASNAEIGVAALALNCSEGLKRRAQLRTLRQVRGAEQIVATRSRSAAWPADDAAFGITAEEP